MQKISFIKDKNMATIIRQSYIDKIEKYLGKETIIVLVGQRRVGKSYIPDTSLTILRYFAMYLRILKKVT